MDANFSYGKPQMVDYTPGSVKTGGSVIVVGEFPLIAHRDIQANELGALASGGGIYDVAADGAMTELQKVYWDDTANQVTLTGGANKHFGFIAPGQTATNAADIIRVIHVPMGGVSTSAGVPSTVAAAGSSQGTAAALSDGFNLVSAADATKGVILPAAKAGRTVWVKNNANAALPVYPATSDAINAIAANGAYTMAALTPAIFVAYDATTWYTFPLVAS